MKNLFLIAILLSTAIFVIPSCQKEDIGQPDGLEAPQLPPSSMFTMPTGEFDPASVDTSGFSENGERNMDTYWHWFYAAINLTVWHTAVVLEMAVPTAAFDAAFTVEPVYIGNLAFQWAYDYVAPIELGGHTYNVVLVGQYAPDFSEVYWTMTLSQVGGFQNFEWYTGVTSTTVNEGTFTLNHQPANPENYLLLTYAGDEATGNAAIRFTRIVPNSPDFGDYVEYRVTPATVYDLAFDVQQTPGDLLEIQWNELGSFGRVRHLAFYGDDNWRCWDGTGKDIDCN